ncbi:hypothetical protein NPIL_363451 [Nephila pilipes]|uniref:Uncharacterized protein n=1 Tax=Nephila pilipes TaxID=299642 RepID=A0A8X6NI56_NEPPI|nr:hypothetical protein NPIL_363451 [Nephila pilipes]
MLDASSETSNAISLNSVILNEWWNRTTSKSSASPREYPSVSIDLHGFYDYSEQCFVAVIYISFKFINGEVKTSLVRSKSKFCPIKALTIPLLELFTALLLTRFVSRVIPILKVPFNHIHKWKDSKVVLA